MPPTARRGQSAETGSRKVEPASSGKRPTSAVAPTFDGSGDGRRLDSWLRHIAETMLMRANVINEGPTRSGLIGWAKEIEDAAKVVEDHNKDVLSRCADKSHCGYASYSRKCPNCPTEFLLEWPQDADPHGRGVVTVSEDF